MSIREPSTATALPSPDVAAIDASRQQGLSADEAARRLRLAGPNELPQPPRRGLARIAWSVLREPMFLLLVAAALIYLVIGDLSEGLLLGAFAALSVGLVVAQESRSEHAIEALRELAAPVARVIRDGHEQRIAAREVVVGDLLSIGEGERVAADAVLQRCEGLALDESLLTGESLPVDKVGADANHTPSASADRESKAAVFAGTLVVRGHGIAEVCAIGTATQTGRIGLSLVSIEATPTLLQALVARLVRVFGIAAGLVTVTVVLLYGILREDWLQGVLSGIAIAMAMLPEEFPMALTVFLALGAWRLAQIKVLARRPAVIETLGATSVLCLDKTGTLTENHMRVRALHADGRMLSLAGDEVVLPEEFHALVEFALLACKRRAFDPMDRAIAELATRTLADTEHLHGQWPLQREYGLSANFPAFSRAWVSEQGTVAASKGAPETIARLCRLSSEQREAVMADVERLAEQGLRVIAVATTAVVDTHLPDDLQALPFAFAGLIGFLDPPRAHAAEAVTQARQAGIAVAMITGDYPVTAAAIARTVGIDDAGGVLAGSDIAAMDDGQLAEAVRRTRVFARIRPDQKLRLIQAFKANGEVVAMTGDGVNDAPALKAAHIGLAMGERGTDVAREAAGIVLLDDDIVHLLDGMRLGRRIYDNLRKVLIYIGAIHIPIAGLALLPILFGLPPLLLPMHVVLIEMVIDPICSIAFESAPAERDLMQRPPRDPGAVMIGAAQLLLAGVQGALLLLACLALYAGALRGGWDGNAARTIAFIALTAGNLMLVRVNAVRGPTLPSLFDAGHGTFWLIAGGASTIVMACIYTPWLASLFRFEPLPLPALVLAGGIGMLAVLCFDLLKRLPAVQQALGGAKKARVAG